MKSTINQLVAIAGMLRGFQKTEPEAPRLFLEYLEMVPVKELEALETDHAEAIAEIQSDFDDQKAELEKAEKNLEDALTVADREADKALAEFNALQERFDELTAKSEHSDFSPTAAATAAAPGDHAMLEALQTSLFIERARVKQLEASLAAKPAAAPVKPLDAKDRDAGKAKRETPAGPVAAATAPPVLTRNPERNGIELRFNGKPDEATREKLTAAKWKWSARQPGQPWYARYTEEQYLFAQSLATGSAYTPMPEAPPAEPEAQAPTPMPMPAAADAPAPRRRTIIIPNF